MMIDITRTYMHTNAKLDKCLTIIISHMRRDGALLTTSNKTINVSLLSSLWFVHFLMKKGVEAVPFYVQDYKIGAWLSFLRAPFPCCRAEYVPANIIENVDISSDYSLVNGLHTT
jgi:hypothetical protein